MDAEEESINGSGLSLLKAFGHCLSLMVQSSYYMSTWCQKASWVNIIRVENRNA